MYRREDHQQEDQEDREDQEAPGDHPGIPRRHHLAHHQYHSPYQRDQATLA
jgi:hypothetical protein